ncbi:MAG: hypothetical protein AAGF11_15685 [Myxococcota bacterium]
MSLTFTDPTSIEFSTYLESNALRVDCEGTTLPVADQTVICEVSAGAVVPFTLEFDDPDPHRTIEVSHLDQAGQMQVWSGSDPCAYSFGLTGGAVDLTVAASSNGETKITIIKLEVKPKTDKPFRR